MMSNDEQELIEDNGVWYRDLVDGDILNKNDELLCLVLGYNKVLERDLGITFSCNGHTGRRPVYRLLKEGEVIQEGDEVLGLDNKDEEDWVPYDPDEYGATLGAHIAARSRRPAPESDVKRSVSDERID